ncbi:MAG: hypothetical protein COA84_14835 [Robiginitomaculum sp.]|nr:MAG: hypothetical protein COA84_14835 [Robiginitomaculum sp.]
MAAYNKYDQTIADVFNKKHDFSSDTFKYALSNTVPSVADNTLAQVSEIAAGNGYTAGGNTVGVTSSTQTGGTLSVVPTADVVFTASGGSIGPFQYVAFYNSTPAGGLTVSYFDRGSAVTLLDGETFTVDVQATLFTAS